MPLRDSSNFFLSAGGYVGIGLFGKNYVPDSYTGTASHDFTFGNTGTQQRMDYGINFNVGYRLRSGYMVSVGYLQGIRDTAPDHAAYEQRNRAYSFTIGYQF
ncbi:hypothetical protein [Parapedobacter tibetensis]|uniref:hypothetical protein n=1 Tax=Parapedobacter tibetensis TaxID=2972951 RepID=UPI00214D1AE5|nr:hypothetical protein [Parapedobacter tibetensis]